MKTLFKNAIVVTLNEKNDILNGYDVLVEDNIIAKIAKNINCENAKIVNCENKVLMPGFINAHSHSPMSLFRGLGENTTFKNWWYEVMRPLEQKASKQDFYYGAVLSYLEMIKNGITTSCDVYMHIEELCKAMSHCKMRGLVGIGGITGTEVLSEKYLENQVLAIKKINPQITPVLYAHSVYSCNEDIFEELISFAKKHNYLLTTHCSETLTEVGDCVSKYDQTPVELLENYGFFDNKCLLAHCVHCDKQDIEILQNYDVSVVSCPSSNLILGSGIAPIYSFKKKGVNVCLGTDGAASNNSLNMFKEMFLLDNLQAGVLNQPGAISVVDTLKMATINGAKALGLKNLGIIKQGCLADIILVELNSPNMQPINDLANNLVNSCNGGNVYLTMVNGEILYCNNKFYLDIDIDEIYSQVNKRINKIKK